MSEYDEPDRFPSNRVAGLLLLVVILGLAAFLARGS